MDFKDDDMYNPFDEKSEEQYKDLEYIRKTLSGDKKSLEQLVLRHQSWIYNIVLTMTSDIHLSEDITQEILIKIITKLSGYDSEKASFRTWLYRIVVNHIINMKKNKTEQVFSAFEKHGDYNSYLANQPDARKSLQPGHAFIKEETRISCSLCMLLCLKRLERIVFVLGIVFNVTDAMGAEICDLSKDNFRKILSRSREKIYRFFINNCSLLKEENPCKCAEQTGNLIKLGAIDPENFFVDRDSYGTVAEVLGSTVDELEDACYEFNALFKSQKFLKGPDMVLWLQQLLMKGEFNNLFVL
ncbi:MAG: RNA polymerase sigma factor [bacterium]|nr:RNA polymerase sigma factor [bacterium]